MLREALKRGPEAG
jgi:hypothetical protein